MFGKILHLLWQYFYAIESIIAVVNDQILKNNLAIWSHCCCCCCSHYLLVPNKDENYLLRSQLKNDVRSSSPRRWDHLHEPFSESVSPCGFTPPFLTSFLFLFRLFKFQTVSQKTFNIIFANYWIRTMDPWGSTN